MKFHQISHRDHGFDMAQWAHILEKYTDRDAFFIDTFELPEELGMVTNELYGPSSGDPPVAESEVVYAKRGDREWDTRFVKKPKRPTRFVRVIAGPHEEECPECGGSGLARSPFNWYSDSGISCEACEGAKVLKHACILYTAYGVASIDTPQSPKEVGDVGKRRKELHAKIRMTPVHALNRQALDTAYFDIDRELAAAQTFWAEHALAAPLALMPCPKCGAPAMGDAVYQPPPCMVCLDTEPEVEIQP